MKLINYLRDKLYVFIIFFILVILIFLILTVFKLEQSVIIVVIGLITLAFVLLLIIDYFRKQKFYTNLLSNIDNLDESYLVLETLEKPSFYEGILTCEAMYNINKSMYENVKKYENQLQDFKEYIEMWIHEVKIPLATLSLIDKNHQNIFDKKTKLQLHSIENYVDQVLYYARCENAEKDYLIKKVSLSKVIKNIGLKNMDILLENKIRFDVSSVDYQVLTDAKWLEFILNQIVNNSIKYKRNIKNSYIKIRANDDENSTILLIEDNGIGIPSSDLRQVFDKSFTGSNGRVRAQSTGMGLFIAKSLCDRLGHQISILSKENEYTIVTITFAKNRYFDVLK